MRYWTESHRRTGHEFDDARAGEIWRERIADWWAGTWRWVLAAFGAVAVTYFSSTVASQAARCSRSSSARSSSRPRSRPRSRSRSRCSPCRACSSRSASVSAVATSRCRMPRSPRRSARRCCSASGRTACRCARCCWLNLVYQFATLFTVIVNPYVLNTVEWFHAWLLVSGALIVGWALGAAGYARLALSLIVFTACVIAVLTLVRGRASSTLSGTSVRRRRRGRCRCTRTSSGPCSRSARSSPTSTPTGWAGRKGWARLAFGLLAAGIVVAQSRQALIGLMAAIIIAVLRREHHRPLPLGAPAAHPGGLAGRQRW